MKQRPYLYFTFRSPYCWLAIERLRRAIPDMHDRIEFIPNWEPDPSTHQVLRQRGADIHYAAMSDAKHRYLLIDVKRLARRDGLRMVWPIDRAPRWEIPHLAWLAGRHAGVGAELYAAIVSSRWERGENICDPAVIRRIAVDIGVDPEMLVSAAEDPDVRAEGIESIVRAWKDDIFGFPYFRVGSQRFWGVDRLPHFLEALLPTRSAAYDEPPDVASATNVYDFDTAGGCG
jgi:2-hydroxychromene-2-carboxylate isomerase